MIQDSIVVNFEVMDQSNAGTGGVNIPSTENLQPEMQITVTPTAGRSITETTSAAAMVTTEADAPAKKLARQLDFAALPGPLSRTASAAGMAQRHQVIHFQSQPSPITLPSPSPIAVAAEIQNQLPKHNQPWPPPSSSMQPPMGAMPLPPQTADSVTRVL